MLQCVFTQARSLSHAARSPCETLLAIGLVFYLSAHLNPLRWLTVAMCISPLLLLRTDESVRLGIEWLTGRQRAGGCDGTLALMGVRFGLFFGAPVCWLPPLL